MESRDADYQKRIVDLVGETVSIREQLGIAKAEYGRRFRELTSRLLSLTKTWRSLHIRKKRLAVEISALQRKCNEMFEEFVELERSSNSQQQRMMQQLSDTSSSEGAAKVQILEEIKRFNLNELSEGLAVRWDLLDKIEAEVNKVESFVRALSPGDIF
jgi:chromosome segregation ATPase